MKLIENRIQNPLYFQTRKQNLC